MTVRTVLACTITTAIGTHTPAAGAQAAPFAPSAATLDPVVVSATRTENPLSSTPASISVVTREDFEDRQAYSVSDVLKTLPNVDFGGGPRPEGQIPGIRGFTGKEIIVLVDGARQNASPGIASPLYADPFFLRQAEVVRGSTSTLYGSGGIGGAMVFRTLTARDLLGPDEHAGADVRTAYASADRSPHYNARFYGQAGMVDAIAAFGYAETGRIRQGGGTTLRPNDGHAGSGLFKLGLQPGKRLRFDLSHQFYQAGSYRPNNPEADSSLGTPSSIPVQMNRINQEQTVLKAALAGEDGKPDLDVTLYHTRLSLSAERNALFPGLPATANVTDTTGASLQQSLRFGGQTIGQRVTYGIDYYRDHQSAASAGAANPVIPDGTQRVFGAFLQDEISLGKAWKLTPSLRGDRFETAVDTSASGQSSNHHVSPKLALSWQPVPQATLFASYGEAYRAPSISEAYQNLSGRNYLFNFAANPNLKPETARTLELGASFHRNAILAGNDSVRLRGSVYASRVKDLISSTVVGTYARSMPFSGTGTITQYQNVTDARSRGAEIEGLYRVGNLDLSAAYSRVRTTDDSTGAYLYSPPDKLVLGIRQALPQYRVALQWNSQFVAAQDYDSTLLRRRPGYAVHNLYMTWYPPAARHMLKVDFGIENLFDKRYFSYQSGNAIARVADVGRNAKIALTASF